jgi:threonine dehydratase
MEQLLQKQDLLDCLQRITPYINRTPVMSSKLINEIAGCNIAFKCENFQRMGAFKIRGASNAILQLNDEQKSKGVVTHSSGNFAQALSLAAKSLGVKAYIVMPTNAPAVKKEAAIAYGAEIIGCEGTLISREETAVKVEQETGATFIHPSNDEQIILGQGTAAMELLEDYPQLDAIIAPVGGGGLLAGTALAAHYFNKDCKVYGGEPEACDDAFRSL